MSEDYAKAISLLKKEMEKRFRVENVKPKFDEDGNFVGFSYTCPKEEHETKAREMDRFFKNMGLINVDYIR